MVSEHRKKTGLPRGETGEKNSAEVLTKVPEAECGLMQEYKTHGSHGHRGHAPAQASSPYTFTGFS